MQPNDDYKGTDRRENHEMRDRLEKITLVLERLTFVSENQTKNIEAHQKWIDEHDEKYHLLTSDMRTTKLIVGQWSREIEKVNKTLETMVDVVSKFKGGWLVIGIIGSLVMGGVSVLGLVLRILGVL